MKNKEAKGQKNGGQAVQGPKKPGGSRVKVALVDIASSTLEKIEQGCYEFDDDKTYDLSKAVREMKDGTLFFEEGCDSALADWQRHCGSSRRRPTGPPTTLTLGDSEEDDEGDDGKGTTTSGSERSPVRLSIWECSTLDGSRALNEEVNGGGSVASPKERIGVLNFASAKNPGGGFQTGAQAQEESIARSSTLYPSLMTDTAQQFYRSHRKNPNLGYYSHAMIYSPRVLLIRSDDGTWNDPPIQVEVVTSCAVNAGVVRRYLRHQNNSDESELEAAMKERMARILCLFEQQGVRHLVLGSFGTGVFRNRVELVAEVWKELLIGSDVDEARFKRSFDRVVFAILGHDTYLTFKRVFSDSSSAVGGDS